MDDTAPPRQADPRLVITCHRPGLHRGGIQHLAVATHPIGAFTHEQLVEMINEPELTLVLGHLVTPQHLGATGAVSLMPQPIVTDAGPREAGLSHAVEPVSVVTADGDVVGTVVTAHGGPVYPSAPTDAEARAQAADIVVETAVRAEQVAKSEAVAKAAVDPERVVTEPVRHTGRRHPR